MAAEDRTTAHNLDRISRTMTAKPYEFGFFAALRLLECLHAEKPRLGTSAHPGDDPIRLGQDPDMSFAPAGLAGFEPAGENQPHRLTVRFMGLLGPNGPLPLHLTEYARQRLQQFGDRTFARFLDIFHHRLFSLFYRAWANNEPTVSFDRPESDRFAEYIGALAGLGMASMRNRDAISDLTKFYYSGRLACQTRSAEGLEDILNDYFQVPVHIEPFVGEWVSLPASGVCRLGLDPANGTLGRSAVIGKRVWACQHKFRIILGPLDLADYQSLLPGGERIGRLTALVRNYIGDELAWEVRLVLAHDQVPPMHLDNRTRLGWTTWLGHRTAAEDPDDLTFNADDLVTRLTEENVHDRYQP